jgi:hypothetical protein
MAPRQISVRVLALVAAAAAAVLLPLSVRADPPAPAVDTAAPAVADAQPYVGVVSGDDVYVRSGPSEQFYATQKLNAGDRVSVVGVRGNGDWLKIAPPEGSFCYVAQVYIDRVPGSDSAGRVKKADLNVRAGSLLNNSMKIVLTTLNAGDTVQILGAPDDKYFKIAPPPGAYLYVQKSFVKPVPNGPAVTVPLAAQAGDREPMASDPVPPPAAAAAVMPPSAAPTVVAPAPAVAPVPAVTPAAAPAVAPVVPPVAVAQPAPVAPPATVAATPVAPPAAVAAVPTTHPAEGAALASAQFAGAGATTRPTLAIAKRVAPSTRPTIVLTPQQQFDRAELEFARTEKQPLASQPLEGLRWRYKTLASNTTLPRSERQLAQSRMAVLNLRIDARQQQVAQAQALAQAAERQRSLLAEQQELAQRVKQQAVTTYAAVGTLRMSSLQQSGATLYRLTDPGTGQTLVYIRSNDHKYTDLLNQFIGVRGQIVTDADLSLRYVSPTEVETVDVNKVNNGIVAAISPPSLLTARSEASAGGN